MKKLFTVLLALVLLTGSALAYSEYITAVSGDTYIRTAPNLNGKAIDVLPQGDAAAYLCKSSVDNRGVCWYLVNYYGTIGWISEKYVQPESYRENTYNGTSCIQSYGTVVATGGDSNIRSWADLSADVRGLFPEGARAAYAGSSCTDNRGVRWDYINYNGMYGWVSSRYTTLY